MSAVPDTTGRITVGELQQLGWLLDSAAARRLTQPSRIWAAMVVALDSATCASIIAGRRVRVGNLDAFFLRRALRGDEPPDSETYILVTLDMLDACHEAGPIAETYPDFPERARPRRAAI